MPLTAVADKSLLAFDKESMYDQTLTGVTVTFHASVSAPPKPSVTWIARCFFPVSVTAGVQESVESVIDRPEIWESWLNFRLSLLTSATASFRTYAAPTFADLGIAAVSVRKRGGVFIIPPEPMPPGSEGKIAYTITLYFLIPFFHVAMVYTVSATEGMVAMEEKMPVPPLMESAANSWYCVNAGSVD